MKSFSDLKMIIALWILLVQIRASFAGSSLFNRNSFPHNFKFGVASSAHQYEGAAFEDGKGPSIWDNFTHQFPEKIVDGSNGDVAVDFYNRYKEDVKLLKFLGVNVFRMSISWPRILPSGKLSGGVNRKGIFFYNNLIDELLAHGISPIVTLFHWDLPQALEEGYEGFLNRRIIDDFKDYAELCFKEFGDRVKYWITLDEPYVFTTRGYARGIYAPGRCSNRSTCQQGNEATEPYIVAHHQLLSHAETVNLYRKKYQVVQKGKIGIALNTGWFIPYSNSKHDVQAVQRALDFIYGWFMDPIVYGNYPKIMQSLVGDRLPNFTKKESAMLKGSIDFLGLNYYTAKYASNILKRSGNISTLTDRMVLLSSTRNDVPIGDPTGINNFYVYPKGLYDLLVYTKEKYNSPTIYIIDHGFADFNNGTITQMIKDPQRINFYIRHLQIVRKAIREEVNVKGLIAWTLLDDFEWRAGHTILYGLFYVDYNNNLTRIPKQSAIWYKNFLNH